MTNVEFKEYREQLGMSQESYGEFLGISLSSVQSFESGKRPIGRQTIMILENHFKYKEGPIAKLLDGHIDFIKDMVRKELEHILPKIVDQVIREKLNATEDHKNLIDSLNKELTAKKSTRKKSS
ncbi:helix-turn-helix domain-containing protein [Spongiimicrobium salis]|uniref:helix-turn-helix domain-containing protein n=1 Tax=Spongiimicrobium salis TaxID=1667022 RepID=UPI00374D8BFD